MKKLTLCLCALAIFIVVACNPQRVTDFDDLRHGEVVQTRRNRISLI